MANFKGADAHLKRMKNMTAGMRREAGKLVYVLADMHATEAALSVTDGAVSGKGHVASAPYDAPNADTHHLDRSIHAERTGPLTAQSIADAEYASRLEFGDSKIVERPFMKPAAQKVRVASRKLAEAAMKAVVRGDKL